MAQTTTTTTTDTRFTDANLDRLADDLNRDGICVLRGLLDPGLIARWAEAFDALFRERQNRPGGLAPREQARFYLTLPFRPPFDDPNVWTNPAILGVLDRVFAQEYVMCQLGADVPLKGSAYQETHRDYRPLFSDDVATPLYALAVNFPLVDVTADNGPFEMALGTHVLGRDEALRRIESGEAPLQQFLMKRGDVMIRTPLALHRGTPNRTDVGRPMVVMGYVMHWLHTPQVDLNVPHATYDALPDAQKKLLRCNVVDELTEAAETYVNFKF